MLPPFEPTGWRVKRPSGSHKLPAREGWPDYELAFHDHDEIGRKTVRRTAKHTEQPPGAACGSAIPY